jgi:hypothetical protein
MIIEQFGWDWHEFKRALRGLDKDVFDALLNHARRHATAGHNMPNPNPFEPIVMSILVEHEKELRRLKRQHHTTEEQSGEMRTCPRCGGVNPVESYYKSETKKQGTHILCEDCRHGLFFH